MTERLTEDRSSEEMSAATKRSFAAAEKASFPSHSVQAVLTLWRPREAKLEVRRKEPAMSAGVRREVRCWPGIRSERARSGMRYGRWAEIFNPEVMLEARATDPRIASAPAKLYCVSKRLVAAV